MGAGATIRPARPDDLPAIVRWLANDPLGHGREEVAEPVPAAHLAAFEQIDAVSRHELLVEEAAGEVVATAQLSFLPGLSHRGAERAERGGARRGGASRRRHRADAAGLDARPGGASRLAAAGWRLMAGGWWLAQLRTDTRRSDARRFYETLGFAATHDGMKLTLPPSG